MLLEQRLKEFEESSWREDRCDGAFELREMGVARNQVVSGCRSCQRNEMVIVEVRRSTGLCHRVGVVLCALRKKLDVTACCRFGKPPRNLGRSSTSSGSASRSGHRTIVQRSSVTARRIWPHTPPGVRAAETKTPVSRTARITSIARGALADFASDHGEPDTGAQPPPGSHAPGVRCALPHRGQHEAAQGPAKRRSSCL